MSVHRTVLCLAVATGCLSFLCVLLTGLLVGRLGTQPLSEAANSFSNLTQIKATFPAHFRTPEEQAQYRAALNSVMHQKMPVLNTSVAYSCRSQSLCIRTVNLFPTAPPASIEAAPGNMLKKKQNTGRLTKTTTPPKLDRRRRQVDTALTCTLDNEREDDLTFHGCCISDSYTAVPGHLTSALGNQQVQIAQFPGLNQYFDFRQCCQARGCVGCQCSQTYHVTSAIVVKASFNGGKHYEAESVLVPGCCMCLNVGSLGKVLPARRTRH